MVVEEPDGECTWRAHPRPIYLRAWWALSIRPRSRQCSCAVATTTTAVTITLPGRRVMETTASVVAIALQGRGVMETMTAAVAIALPGHMVACECARIGYGAMQRRGSPPTEQAILRIPLGEREEAPPRGELTHGLP